MGSRKLRIVEVAEGKDDRDFALQLHILTNHDAMWALLPPSFHTVRDRALAFRCVARLGCAHHKILASRHQRFPFRTFLSLLDPTKADDLASVPECVLDDWTKRLKQLYPTFSGFEFRQALYSVGLVTRVCVSNIESRHASVRRILTARSVQTHPMAFPDLSGQWLFQQFRTQRRAARTGRQTMRGRGVPKASAAGSRKRKRSSSGKRQRTRAGCGGAWRAWERMFARKFKTPGGRVDAQALARAYRIARRDRTDDYEKAVRVGKEATKRGRREGTQRGFGKPLAQQQRKQGQVQKWALALQMRGWSSDPATRALTLASRTFGSGRTVASTLAVARRVKAMERADDSAREKELASALARYQDTHGLAAIRAVKNSVPAFRSLPMVAHPSHVGCALGSPRPERRRRVCSGFGSVGVVSRQRPSSSDGGSVGLVAQHVDERPMPQGCAS